MEESCSVGDERELIGARRCRRAFEGLVLVIRVLLVTSRVKFSMK